MSNLLTPEADSVWMDQMFGLNYLTIALLVGLLLIGIIARFVTMWLAPRVLKKIIPSDSIQSKTVKDSDKALGTAAGAGIMLYALNALIQAPCRRRQQFHSPECTARFATQSAPIRLRFIDGRLGFPFGCHRQRCCRIV